MKLRAVARDLLVIVNRAGRRTPLADWSLRIYREMSDVDQLYQNISSIIMPSALPDCSDIPEVPRRDSGRA